MDMHIGVDMVLDVSVMVALDQVHPVEGLAEGAEETWQLLQLLPGCARDTMFYISQEDEPRCLFRQYAYVSEHLLGAGCDVKTLPSQVALDTDVQIADDRCRLLAMNH
jgi:hypothetical protein